MLTIHFPEQSEGLLSVPKRSDSRIVEGSKSCPRRATREQWRSEWNSRTESPCNWKSLSSYPSIPLFSRRCT